MSTIQLACSDVIIHCCIDNDRLSARTRFARLPVLREWEKLPNETKLRRPIEDMLPIFHFRDKKSVDVSVDFAGHSDIIPCEQWFLHRMLRYVNYVEYTMGATIACVAGVTGEGREGERGTR